MTCKNRRGESQSSRRESRRIGSGITQTVNGQTDCRQPERGIRNHARLPGGHIAREGKYDARRNGPWQAATNGPHKQCSQCAGQNDVEEQF